MPIKGVKRLPTTFSVLAQKFNLSLDLGDYYAYVFDRKLREADCKQPSRPRRFFDRYGSTTYKQQTSDHWGFGLEGDQYFVSLVNNSHHTYDLLAWEEA